MTLKMAVFFSKNYKNSPRPSDYHGLWQLEVKASGIACGKGTCTGLHGTHLNNPFFEQKILMLASSPPPPLY